MRIDLGKTLKALVASIRIAMPKMISLRRIGSTAASDSTSEDVSKVQISMINALTPTSNVICVPTIPGPICYEIHRDGYIKVV